MVRVCVVLSSQKQYGLAFFFNDTATTEIYTLSLHDALPISLQWLDMESAIEHCTNGIGIWQWASNDQGSDPDVEDRKSTRLNSSHSQISYAVFCLKKKKNRPPKHIYDQSHTS